MQQTKTIEVVPYNPAWPKMFAMEAEKIKQALGDSCTAIHHIGSTSVPELNDPDGYVGGAEEYRDIVFVQAVLAQLTWYHNLTLLDKISLPTIEELELELAKDLKK